MPKSLTKLIVPLPKENLARAATESIWVEPEDDGTYRIKNVPFLARGFSSDDTVKASLKDGLLSFEDVAQHNGHSTYQVFVKGHRSDPKIQELAEALESLKCGVEFASDRFLAVDVKPDADIYAVYAELEKAEASGLIDFQEGHCGHKLRTN